MYRRGQVAFEQKVKEINAERYFYGKEGEISVDNQITTLESEYATFVRGLRAEQDRSKIVDPRIGSLVAHLNYRSKHLRQSLRESTEYLLDEILEYLSDFDNFKDALLRDPSFLQNELRNLLEAATTATDAQKNMLIEFVGLYAPSLFDENRTELESKMRELFVGVRKILPQAVKEGHIKALVKDPSPGNRAKEYSRLNWFIRHTEDPMILGDSGCLFETFNKRTFKPFSDKGDKIANLFLPIETHRVLVGTSFAGVPEVDVVTLNKAIAKCSHEYFVCSEASPFNNSLSSSIGLWAGIISQTELVELASELIRDIQVGLLSGRRIISET